MEIFEELKMEPWTVCMPVVADLLGFDEDQIWNRIRINGPMDEGRVRVLFLRLEW
jgi:hypothetical protein